MATFLIKQDYNWHLWRYILLELRMLVYLMSVSMTVLHSNRCEYMIMYTCVHFAHNVISFFTCELWLCNCLGKWFPLFNKHSSFPSLFFSLSFATCQTLNLKPYSSICTNFFVSLHMLGILSLWLKTNKMRISYDFVRFQLIDLGVRRLGSQIHASMWSGFY
jgi:hypothetical protein